MAESPWPTYEGQGFLKEVGGLPIWWGGGIAYVVGRRGGNAVTEDAADMLLVVLRGVSDLEETWRRALRRGVMVMYLKEAARVSCTGHKAGRRRGLPDYPNAKLSVESFGVCCNLCSSCPIHDWW